MTPALVERANEAREEDVVKCDSCGEHHYLSQLQRYVYYAQLSEYVKAEMLCGSCFHDVTVWQHDSYVVHRALDDIHAAETDRTSSSGRDAREQ